MFYFNTKTKQNPCRDKEHTFIITVVQACKTQKKSSAHIKRCFSCSGLCEPVSHLLSLPFKIHGIHWPGDMRRMMVVENCLRKRLKTLCHLIQGHLICVYVQIRWPCIKSYGVFKITYKISLRIYKSPYLDHFEWLHSPVLNPHVRLYKHFIIALIYYSVYKEEPDLDRYVVVGCNVLTGPLCY